MEKLDITEYVIHLVNEKRRYNVADYPVAAHIRCTTTDESKMYVYIVFIDGETLPPNLISSEGLIYVFVSSRFYAMYLDLLRNERPIQLWWYPDTYAFDLCTAAREPVGEGPGEES